MKCPKCNSENFINYGSVTYKKGKTLDKVKIKRYKCKECDCQFTRSTPKGRPDEDKKLAVALYLEGLGFRAIGRVLNVSNVAVLNWIEKIGEECKRIHELNRYSESEKRVRNVQIMEIDEIWTYVKQKKTKDGYGGVLIDTSIPLLAGKLVVVE